jgi:hypothetical protein
MYMANITSNACIAAMYLLICYFFTFYRNDFSTKVSYLSKIYFHAKFQSSEALIAFLSEIKKDAMLEFVMVGNYKWNGI